MTIPIEFLQRPGGGPHGICGTLWHKYHMAWQDYYSSAPIAPAPRQTHFGSARARRASMPPSAATGSRDRSAIPAQRAAPKAGAPGWLAVGNAGERNARSAPARAARRSSRQSCAELVTRTPRRPAARGLPPRQPFRRPARRCTPAPSSAASRASPATTRASRRARHNLARSRPSSARPGAPSWRSTTPHRPFGNRATAGRGSGSRAASVNSHSTGMSRRNGVQR